MALSADVTSLWYVSLAVGAVVVVVVAVLLGLLLHLVNGIADGGRRLLGVAGGVAGNTGNIKVALDVADTLDAVIEEAGRHARLLGVGQ